MISFNDLTERENERIISVAGAGLDADALSYLEYALDFFLGLKEHFGEGNVALCSYSNLLLSRLFDGEDYYFSFPIDITGEGGEREGCLAIADYTVKEEIPLLFCDVDVGSLELIRDIFKHIAVLDESDGVCTVRVLNEVERFFDRKSDFLLVKRGNDFEFFDTPPDAFIPLNEELTVYPMRFDKDKDSYTRLALEEETNRYWGYSPSSDYSSKDSDAVFKNNLFEMQDGRILSLALKKGARLIGEALFHGFDYRGKAEIGVRLLKEYQCRGYGKSFMPALLLVARELGITRLCATVDVRNTTSLAFFRGFARTSERARHPYNDTEVEVFDIAI